MDGHAYIGELFSGVFFIVAGARLLRLSRRTREIGVRKAIGASDRDVFMQFLVEAVVVTAAGGVAVSPRSSNRQASLISCAVV